MATTKSIEVKELKLDLKNFRALPQSNEAGEVYAIVTIKPDWFWALTESLLDGGYLPTENIIVLRGGKDGQQLIVKEGNRRVAAMKLLHGFISMEGLSIPSATEAKMKGVTDEWKKSNLKVPCAIYESEDADKVDRIVTLAHGKGAQAGRDNWTSVARARHNRAKSKGSEPGLDLLEKYLKEGKNLTPQESEQWAGDYNLTVLDEAILRIAIRLNLKSPTELANSYPKIKHRAEMETVLYNIGLGNIKFETIRNKIVDFAQSYKFPPPPPPPSQAISKPEAVVQPVTSNPTPPIQPQNTGTGLNPPPGSATKPIAFALNDPKSVIQKLKQFSPLGNNREKVVLLLKEARNLKLEMHAHSFCFLLRSMFEISAKAYCKDHTAAGLSMNKPNSEEKKLVEILKEISIHLTKNNIPMTKVLHGASAELGKSEGFLSVTSMNQLVHSPTFSVDETHISTLFNNIFPLLEAMNS